MPGEVAILGVGMHPWGKWGRNFVEYGVKAARTRSPTRGSPGATSSSSRAATRSATATPATWPRRASPRRSAGTARRWRAPTAPAPPARRRSSIARAQILAGLCDVALVVGADTTPKGFFAPAGGGERTQDPDWLRFRLLGATNPDVLRPLRAAPHGSLRRHRAATSRRSRSRTAATASRTRTRATGSSYTQEEIAASPIVSDPLRLLEICATSDGGAALVLSSLDYAQKRGAKPVTIAAVSTVTPRYPNMVIEMPNFATDAAVGTGVAVPDVPFRDSIAKAAYEQAGLGPEDLSLAEVYDLSSALELDWYENIGLCKPGEAEKLLRAGDTAARRARAGEHQRRPLVLRRGDPGAGDRPGLRAHLAAPRPGRRPPGPERQARPRRQPGPLRPRLRRPRQALRLRKGTDLSV